MDGIPGNDITMAPSHCGVQKIQRSLFAFDVCLSATSRTRLVHLALSSSDLKCGEGRILLREIQKCIIQYVLCADEHLCITN